MRINFPRLKQDLEALGTIGRTPEGGVSRPSWSDADMQARGWLMDRITAAGMEARVDAAGNIFGRWQPGSPAVLVGSHIDSVPNGGIFDGALGVLAGLECLRRIKEEGIRLHHPLELVAFTDEEGAFGGFFGSYAFTGVLKPEEIPNIRDSAGHRILDAMARHGLDAMQAPGACRDPKEIHAYVELHIEQGPVLETRKIPIGVVDAIVGIRRDGIMFRGRADHAGTTPMQERRNALLGAADLTLWGLEVSVEAILEIDPAPMAGEVRAAIVSAAEELGYAVHRLPAMAGHDAQVVGRVTKAGMIFVPSRDGRSHSPLEFTADEDVERGANVLLLTLLKLAVG